MAKMCRNGVGSADKFSAVFLKACLWHVETHHYIYLFRLYVDKGSFQSSNRLHFGDQLDTEAVSPQITICKTW